MKPPLQECAVIHSGNWVESQCVKGPPVILNSAWLFYDSTPLKGTIQFDCLLTHTLMSNLGHFKRMVWKIYTTITLILLLWHSCPKESISHTVSPVRSVKSAAKALSQLTEWGAKFSGDSFFLYFFFMYLFFCRLIVLVCPWGQVLVQLLQTHHKCTTMLPGKVIKNRWLHLGKHCSEITPFLLSVSFCGCSSPAVRGVCRWQWSLHQVSAGARPGLDHLLRRWGKLQGGCEEDSDSSIAH